MCEITTIDHYCSFCKSLVSSSTEYTLCEDVQKHNTNLNKNRSRKGKNLELRHGDCGEIWDIGKTLSDTKCHVACDVNFLPDDGIIEEMRDVDAGVEFEDLVRENVLKDGGDAPPGDNLPDTELRDRNHARRLFTNPHDRGREHRHNL